MRWLLVAVALSAFGCDCSTNALDRVNCKTHPDLSGCPAPPVVMQKCSTGLVTGKICSPTQHGPVDGAQIAVTAECNGNAVNAHATADSGGNFSLTLPEGDWTLHATSGTFQRDYQVTVAANMTTTLPADPACSAPPSCDLGTVTGVICAPDQHTLVADANVSVSGTCNGSSFSVQTTADAMGNFSLQVPAGTWTLEANAGSFNRSYMVTVTAGGTTNIPADQLCFQQNSARLGVITGPGDHIETLLTQLGFQPKTFDGSSSGFGGAGGGLSVLKDPNQLKQLDVLFIDCGAGRVNGTIDFGADTNTIAQNLRDFVQNGGSLYASDWAFMFIHVAFPEFHWKTANGSMNMPFDTKELLGYAPQSIAANVVDADLRNYLNKSTVNVDFPTTNGAKSLHWGLMDTTSGTAQVLISGSAEECDSSSGCTGVGGTVSPAPLAVLLRQTAGPGGAVIYTSFHNISQSTADVGNILKYLIFKL